MKKLYINDFCYDLNYEGIILYVDNDIDLDALFECLKEDLISHMNRFDCVRDNRLFYIENCDLQDIATQSHRNELYDLIKGGYSVLQLKQDSVGYYVHVPSIF